MSAQSPRDLQFQLFFSRLQRVKDKIKRSDCFKVIRRPQFFSCGIRRGKVCVQAVEIFKSGYYWIYIIRESDRNVPYDMRDILINSKLKKALGDHWVITHKSINVMLNFETGHVSPSASTMRRNFAAYTVMPMHESTLIREKHWVPALYWIWPSSLVGFKKGLISLLSQTILYSFSTESTFPTNSNEVDATFQKLTHFHFVLTV